MRFVCDSCRAQYMISDDKVGARGVKVRCKKCGHVILVRREGLLSEAAAQPRPEPMPQAAVNGTSPDEAAQNEAAQNETAQNEQSTRASSAARALLAGVEDDEIGAVFDHAISSLGGTIEPGPAADPPSGPTAEEREAARQVEEPPSNGASEQASVSFQWFVAIDEKQVGPLSFDQLKQLWDHGEVGPDSLCWRAGLSDWSALSDVAELARLLAPKPVRPVIVAAAPVDAPYPVSKGPVESAFSAGSSSKVVRPESPASAGASSVGAESGGWRPSAASALASLMKEEIETLAKPPAQRIEEPAQAAGLLDLPAPMVNGRQGKNLKAPPESEGAQTGLGAPHSYAPSFGYGRSPSRRGLIITLFVCGGVLLLALVVVSTILLSRSGSSETSATTQERPKGASKTETAAAPSTDREKSAAGATHGQSGPPPATAVSDAPAAQSNQVPTAVGAKAVDSKADAPTLNHLEPTSTVTSPAHAEKTGTHRNRSARTASNEITTPAKNTERPQVAVARPAPTASDDDFDREFGGADKRKSPVPKPEPTKHTSVYVPPAPGAEIPESLGTGEIMRIVLDNKPAIKKCVEEQKKRDGSLSGKIVMSWTILASGKTTGISCASDEFKSSYMAQCMSGLIKGWQFPRHKMQGDPINFPFTF